MALTREQAKELSESLADVFTPEGDAGVIARIRHIRGKGLCARVDGANVDGWFPLDQLDSKETLWH